MTPNLRVRILGEGRLLQIQPTQVSDSGRYLCVATNVAGEDDQDFNVLIQGEWGHGAGVSETWGMSVLLGRSGRRALFLITVCTSGPPEPWPGLFHELTWGPGHHCPPGLSFTFVKYG